MNYMRFNAQPKSFKYWLYVLSITIILFQLLVTPSPYSEAATGFQDLPSNDPNYPYAKFLLDKNILTGYSDGKFLPHNNLTRAEMAVLMIKVLGLKPITPKRASYKDVKSRHWAYKYIEQAKQSGLIKGFPDGSFRPEGKITRAQTAVLLLSLTKEQLPSVSIPEKITDVRPGYWARPYIAAAIDSGIMRSKSDEIFSPETPSTRIEVARGLALTCTLAPELRETSLMTECVTTKGSVTVTIPGSSPRSITSMVMCPKGTSIKTDAKSECDLKFPDGSSILMKSNSELIIKEARGQVAIKNDGTPCILIDMLEVSLPHGKIYGGLASTYFKKSSTNLEKTSAINNTTTKSDLVTFTAEKPSETSRSQWYKQATTSRTRVKVDMPWTVAGIRGTFWGNAVSSTGQSSTSVITGEVSVSSGGSTVSVGPGQSTSISSAGAPPAAPAPMPAAEQQAWTQVQSWVQETAAAIQNNAPVPPPAPGPETTTETTSETTTGTTTQTTTPDVVSEVTQAFNTATGESSSSTSSGTSSGGGGGSSADTVAPTVIATNPSQNAINVSPSVYFNLTLSEPITVDPANFNLKCGASNQEIVSIYVPSGSPNMVAINAGKLEYSSTYTLNVTNAGIKDLAGNYCSAFTLQFTTEADTYGPMLSGAPALNPDNIGLCVYFNEPVFSNVYQLDDYIYSSSDNGVTFNPVATNGLASTSGNVLFYQYPTVRSGSQNKIKILANALKDSLGNVQTTELITEPFAADGTPPTFVTASLASTGKTVYLNYNEYIYDNTAGIIKDYVYIATDGSNFIPLAISDSATIDSNMLVLTTPNGKITGNNTKFRVASNAVKDMAGNIAAGFDTPAIPDPVAPAFVSGSAVFNSVYLNIYFDENLDPAKVPTVPAFQVTVNSSPATVDTVTISGNCLIITLNVPISNSGIPVSVTCLEAADTNNYIRDVAGNHLGDLTTGTFFSSP